MLCPNKGNNQMQQAQPHECRNGLASTAQRALARHVQDDKRTAECCKHSKAMVTGQAPQRSEATPVEEQKQQVRTSDLTGF